MANVVFLCARYAHHFGGEELLGSLLSSLVSRVSRLARSKADDMCFTAYWLSNVSYLLYYLRREPGLLVSTAAHQQELNKLIQDIFTIFVRSTIGRLEKVLGPAIMDYESIPGGETIKYDVHRKSGAMRPRATSAASRASRESISTTAKGKESTTAKGKESTTNKSKDEATVTHATPNAGGLFGSAFNYFRKGNSTQSSSESVVKSTSNLSLHSDKDQEAPVTSLSQSSQGRTLTQTSQAIGQFFYSLTSRPPPPHTLSPRTVTTILSSSLFVLQCYEVPEIIQAQVLRQLFIFTGTFLLNHLLESEAQSSKKMQPPTKRYCARWKAVCIRMNLSVLEDWVRYHTTATTLMVQTKTPSPPPSSYGDGRYGPLRSPIHRRASNSGASVEKSQRRGFDGLLQPLANTSPESITKYLKTVIAAVQLLQIATTTFGEDSPSGATMVTEDVEAVQLQWFYLLLDTVGRSTEKEILLTSDKATDQPLKLQEDDSLEKLSFPQIHRILVQNYVYEKEEPNLDGNFFLVLDGILEGIVERLNDNKRSSRSSLSSTDSAVRSPGDVGSHSISSAVVVTATTGNETTGTETSTPAPISDVGGEPPAVVAAANLWSVVRRLTKLILSTKRLWETGLLRSDDWPALEYLEHRTDPLREPRADDDLVHGLKLEVPDWVMRQVS